MSIGYHPLADIFPLIEGAEFDALVDDIREHGLAEKIVLHDGRILDGRNRYRALVQIGLTDEEILRCYTETFDKGDPLAFVISKNMKRRHLDESQRAMVAAGRRGSTQRSSTSLPKSLRTGARSAVS
jgi:hypothetical protein